MARYNEDSLRAIFERGSALPEENKMLTDFCEMVYKRHFIYRVEHKDDLIGEGLLGIYSLIGEGYYDGESSAYNFMYARVRNVMKNFLYKEDRGYNEESSYFDKEGVLDKGATLEDGAVEKIVEFVKEEVNGLALSDRFKYYILAYFYDKLGVEYEIQKPNRLSVDFIDKYRYYVNLIEFGIFDKFLGGRVFNNKISDIVGVFACKGEMNAFTTLFFETFTNKQISMLLYVFAGSNIKIPSKYRLLKVDNYISIYKRRLTGTSEENVAKMFGKPAISVNSIFEQYGKIFDKLDEEED